jgi:hypothetical protein
VCAQKNSCSYEDSRQFAGWFCTNFLENRVPMCPSFEGWAKRVIINNALQKLKGVRYIEVQDENIS